MMFYLKLCQPPCLAEQNHLHDLGIFCEIILLLDQSCTYDIERVYACLTEARISFYLTLFRLPDDLPRVESYHYQHIAHKIELICTCAGLFLHYSRRI